MHSAGLLDHTPESEGGTKPDVKVSPAIDNTVTIGCDGHTNYRSHQRCDWSHRLFRVMLTAIPPFTLLCNCVQPLF